MFPRQINRQFETIPEYEPDFISNPLPTTQSNNNNRRSPSSPTRNKAVIKRSGNQIIPMATDTFANVPEQVSLEKYLTGMNIFHE